MSFLNPVLLLSHLPTERGLGSKQASVQVLCQTARANPQYLGHFLLPLKTLFVLKHGLKCQRQVGQPSRNILL